MMKFPNIAVVIIWFAFPFVFSQEKVDAEILQERIRESFELLSENPEKAFREAVIIEETAMKINAPRSELSAIIIQCIYYRGKHDFEKMMAKAQALSEKSSSYKANAFQVIAKRFLFEAYYFSGLPEKAFDELEQGSLLAERLKGRDSLNVISKGDLYVSFSNYYALQEDYARQLKFLKLAGNEFERMPNAEARKKLLTIHNSNVAAAYNQLNALDSAKYYTKFSQALNEDVGHGGTRITNLWVMGSVAMKEKDYETALDNFIQAEKIAGYGNHLNIGSLYDNIIACYRALGQDEAAMRYAIKNDSLKLSIAENQNKSLHKLLKEKENSGLRYPYMLAMVVALLFVMMYLIVRKRKILVRQEQDSQNYLQSFPENQKLQSYTQLLHMLEQGDPAFMNYFDGIFPDFAKKLLKINPRIVQSEIEFCSLLKLKIPTKDIARYKFITPKTVQNKKYLIRKKLGIPKETDIYQWFDVL